MLCKVLVGCVCVCVCVLTEEFPYVYSLSGTKKSSEKNLRK